MRKLIFVFALTFLNNIEINSQEVVNSQDYVPSSSMTLKSFDRRDKNLTGSSYINEKFLPAKVSNSDVIYPTRYNAYQDEMEIKKDDNIFYLNKRGDLTVTFIQQNKTYKIYNYEDDNQSKASFFVVLNSGEKVSLLLKEKVKFYDEVKPSTGYDTYQPPKLKREKDKLYIGFKNNKTKELPKKKKDVLGLFASKEKEIGNFVKKNKLNLKDNDDLITVFSHYNSLN